jgi:hypothetical protein
VPARIIATSVIIIDRDRDKAGSPGFPWLFAPAMSRSRAHIFGASAVITLQTIAE